MNRADQIRDRLEAIDAELAIDPPEVGPSNADGFLTWLMESMSPEKRTALMEERRRLRREFDLLPAHLKQGSDA